MKSVSEAKALIRNNIQTLPELQLGIDEALDYVLAADIYSPTDVPYYNQSSMDGYALKFDPAITSKPLNIIGVVQAGSGQTIAVNEGEAVRIFTGAALPAGADTVVMQEKTVTENNLLYIDEESGLSRGANVRLKGEEIKEGALGLTKGTILNAAGIGFLASIGISKVKVFGRPRVGILVTGDELVTIGKPLGFGQVYESNSHTVKAYLQSIGINSVKIYKAHDDLDVLVEVMKEALAASDLLLLTGGISVGEFDYVSRATQILGIEQVFHKIKQKPGKPMFFGKKENKIIFGLPGNPTSVLTCAYQYVTIALATMSGSNKHLTTMMCTATNHYKKPTGITHFLKGHYYDNHVEILDGQESYKLKSYAMTNCLIELEEEVTEVNTGQQVKIYLIP